MKTPIRQIDRFAEALAASEGTADDGNVSKAARRVGLKAENGNALLQRIRRGLGRQAV
jgi:hypothetical protein